MANLADSVRAVPVSGLGTNEIREDLRDIITNVDPVDTPLFALAGSVDAGSIRHEWLIDSLLGIDPSGATEGAQLTATSRGRPSRDDNFCQILRIDYGVSDTEDAVDKAGMNTMFAYQTSKAMRELARNTEFALINNTRTDVDPLEMDGLATFIQTTNNDNSASATLAQNDFHILQNDVFDQSGVQPDTALVSPRHKRAISTWYTSVTREVGNLSDVLGTSITEAITDFGPMQFVIERYTQTITATVDELYILPMSLTKKAWLIPTKVERQARDGDLTPGMVMHQLTLEVLNELAFGRLQAGNSVIVP